LIHFYKSFSDCIPKMSLNKVKSKKSSVAGGELKKKIVSLQFKLRKVKAEKLALVKEWQESTEVFENVEKGLKLEIENEKREMKEVVERHNKIFEKFKETLECPVCMEIPRSGPVFVCPNGHFVCKKCKTGSCPTCRASMGNGKSLLAITVIENIDHKCRFVECEELFAREKLDNHEKICKHRIVKCPYSECKVEMALSKLLDHLGKKTCCFRLKPSVIDVSSKTGKSNFNIVKFSSIENQGTCWKVDTFSYRGTSFAICPQKIGNCYYFTMVMFESKEVCSKYKIEIEVHERGLSRHDSDVGIRFRGNPCSIDEDKALVKYRGVSVHQEVMKTMPKRNEDLPFTLSFSFSEKRAREPEELESAGSESSD